MSGKLTIRDWTAQDMPQLAQFHGQMGVGYQIPESFGPLYFVGKTVADENGTTVGIATVKLVGEAFLWLNPEISALAKAKGVKLLHEELEKAASAAGLEEVSCWIPPKIAEWFSKTIEKLGWRVSPWRNWTIILKGSRYGRAFRSSYHSGNS